MSLSISLRPEEKAAFSLRALYESYGYSCYRMSKFEEYDFYAGNKDFLVSQEIITFTDVNGKLMALKPDVTLSIIKHLRDIPGMTQKFFYDEKIYRVPKNSNSFKEITQAGIECIGSLDDYCMCEVIELAIQSLKKISHGRKYILDISNLGLLSEVIPENSRREFLKLISEKNTHEIKNLDSKKFDTIIKLIELDGRPEKAIVKLKEIFGDDSRLIQLEKIVNVLKIYHDEINIDFSVVGDLNYYNGIIFRGFIQGIPESVLSGGQYDNLMLRMGHENSQAIGFAVYLDLLNQLEEKQKYYDADVLIIYDNEKNSPEEIRECVSKFINNGENVITMKNKNDIKQFEFFKVKQVVRLYYD